jgi:beta-phosphoglucomutase-like phosphatase (HAD superfamily)
MIRAVVFDLDGTLVQTERPKALSYGRAALALTGEAEAEERAIQAFKAVVGMARSEVASHIVESAGLEEAAAARMEETGTDVPWCVEDSLVGLRAALAAGMWCIAATTEFTSVAIHESGLLEKRCIVDDHARLAETIEEMFEARRDG